MDFAAQSQRRRPGAVGAQHACRSDEPGHQADNLRGRRTPTGAARQQSKEANDRKSNSGRISLPAPSLIRSNTDRAE
jgi:hypothetical protein